MTDGHRLSSEPERSIDMADSSRNQWFMGTLAIVGFVAAGLVTYSRQSGEGNDETGLPRDAIAEIAAGADGAYNPKQVVRAIRPIKDAPFIKADEVAGQVSDNELVLGIEIKGQARAYPINMLCGPSREIINDHVGNLAIAATW